MARRPARAPLNVYLNARLVGRLRRESSGAIDFQYDKQWLAWENAIPVSVSLPLREDRYIGDPVVAVFDNLLPDNDDIRRRVAERAHADGADAYSLLSAIGRDCIGALQFLPDSAAPGAPAPLMAAPLAIRRSPPFSATLPAIRSASAPTRTSAFLSRARRKRQRCFTGKTSGTCLMARPQLRTLSSRRSGSCRTEST